jgi:uncharacterized membrane protein
MKIIFLIALILASGCLFGEKSLGIKLDSEIVPNKISLEDTQSLKLETRVTNVGNTKEVITADAIATEGLDVHKPIRTNFALKPGESRIIIFNATLTEYAVPGDYVIDIQITTDTGKILLGTAKLRVVQKKGII